MDNPISFTLCNFFARQSGYNVRSWWEGASAATDHFRPVSTFKERFQRMISEVAELGFDTVDLWEGHLHYKWATVEHIHITKEVLKEFGIRPTCINMTVGPTADDFVGACHFVKALGIDLIIAWDTNALNADRPGVTSVLREHGVRYALENHPEKTPDEILTKIGHQDADVLGIALDTGWFGTQNFSAPEAIVALRDRTMAVHLKDVLETGAHRTCPWGDGIVDIRASVNALHETGYKGPLTIEHEPEKCDPRPGLASNLALLKHWMVS